MPRSEIDFSLREAAKEKTNVCQLHACMHAWEDALATAFDLSSFINVESNSDDDTEAANFGRMLWLWLWLCP